MISRRKKKKAAAKKKKAAAKKKKATAKKKKAAAKKKKAAAKKKRAPRKKRRAARKKKKAAKKKNGAKEAAPPETSADDGGPTAAPAPPEFNLICDVHGLVNADPLSRAKAEELQVAHEDADAGCFDRTELTPA
jgi:hypothetical protein